MDVWKIYKALFRKPTTRKTSHTTKDPSSRSSLLCPSAPSFGASPVKTRAETTWPLMVLSRDTASQMCTVWKVGRGTAMNLWNGHLNKLIWSIDYQLPSTLQKNSMFGDRRHALTNRTNINQLCNQTCPSWPYRLYCKVDDNIRTGYLLSKVDWWLTNAWDKSLFTWCFQSSPAVWHADHFSASQKLRINRTSTWRTS